MDTHSPALAARTAAPTGAAFARAMTPDEAAHLDRLREWLHGDGTDATDAAALDARWARLLATHPPEAPAPAGVAAAIGIAVGDLLVANVTDAVWRMCPGPEGATPGVLLPERPHMPVLPVLDAHARWRVRSPEWTVDYVERASAHLRRLRPAVPTPHPAPEAVADEHVEPAPAPVDDTPTATPEPAAWAPTFVEDVAPAQPEPAAAWTPTFAEEPSEPAAWTPTIVEDGSAAEPEAAAWEAAPAEDAPTEPAAWTPTFVEDTATADAEQEAWRTPVDETTAPEPAAWTPTIVAASEDAETAHHEVLDVLAAPLTGAVAVVDEPAAWTPTVAEGATTEDATTSYEEPAAHAEPVAYAEPATSAEPVTYEEPAAPEPAVMPWDATAPTTAFPTPGRGLPVTTDRALTPEDLPHRPSERVQDLALRALELALDRAVRDVAGSAPFVLVREGYDVEVLDFPHSDEGVAMARAAARDGGYTAAAVAWTSPADPSRPYPRVVVDASAAGRPGIRVAHSFLHDEHGGHEIGGPQVVGQSAPVL